jgi:hypothetical protein
MQFKKILFFAMAAVVTIGLLMPLTVSAAGWSAPFALGGGNIKPSVAIGSDGSVHYLWYNGSTIQYVKCNGLAKSSCGSVENLPNKGPSYYPSLALDANNRANAVWEAKDGSASVYSIYYSRRNGSKWSTPKRLSTEAYSELPDIAIGGDGTIHVVYQNKSGQDGFINYTTANANMDFSAPIVLEQMTSDKPLPVVAEVGLMTPEGNLASGFYPRVAADGDGKAYAVWQMPSPGYGIGFRYQTNGSDWSATKKLGGSNKDQTPDVTVNKNNQVGVVWTMYDSGDISFAEFNGGSVDYQEKNVDEGLEDSFWPKIAADCTGAFHFAYQGRASASGNWDIYHATYNPDSNAFGSRTTIASISATEQTPAIDATNVAAIAYTNSTNGIIDASTNNLNLNCSNATATPTFTPSPTNTPDPNVTPPDTITIANTAKCASYDGVETDCIHYRKAWKAQNANKATDGNYSRCETNKGVCGKKSAAKIYIPDGYTQVKWFTAKSKMYGQVNVWINDTLAETLDMCQGSRNTKPQFINRTYTIPERNDGQPRSFELGAPSKHTACSPYNSNFVVVDGFEILP